MAITKLQPFNLDSTANYTFANITTGNANLGNAATANYFIGSGNNLSNIQSANLSGQVANALVSGTVYTNAQPNITSVGSLTGLTVSNATGVVNFTTTANVTLGTVANVHITGGSSSQYLQTDGVGNLSWSTISSSAISNGTSNVNIPTVDGNVNITAAGNTTMVVTGTGANITGTANVSGVSSFGANVNLNSNYINNLHDPFAAQDAATKNYVDTVAKGLNIHEAAYVATTGTLDAATSGTVSYNNGASGVGANLVTTGTFYLIDGGNVQTVGTRILVKNEANQAWNGVYTYSNTTVIVRAEDFDTPTEVNGGDFLFITSGATLADTGWVQITDNVVIGTSNLVFDQFSGVGTYQAGNGLTLTGQVFSVNVAQPTITSVGTLTSLLVGNATANTTFGNGTITALGNVSAANLIGPLANGTSNVNIPTANGNVNITAAGNTTLVITGTGANITGTLDVSGNANIGLGNVVWNGTNFRINTTSIQLGANAGLTTQGANSVAIGVNAGNNFQGANSIAIGSKAGGNAASVSTNYVSGVIGTNYVSGVIGTNYVSGIIGTTYVSGGEFDTTLIVADTTGITAGMQISAPSFTSGQTVVSVTNGTTLEISASADSTPDGLLIFTTLSMVVVDTTGITAGMEIFGTGFTSGQTVVSVTNGTTLVISAPADVVPSGLLRFTYLFIEVVDTTGINVGMEIFGTGFTSGQTVVSVPNGTTVTITTPPNIVPSGLLIFTDLTMVVVATTGITAGMKISGTGFTSGQKVASIIDGTTLTITAAPNLVPSGSLTFVGGQGDNSVAVGIYAGFVMQGGSAVAIGAAAGGLNQGANSVAIGLSAGVGSQGANSVAIGNDTGGNTQGANSVAIGLKAGTYLQSNNSVAIGSQAGAYTQAGYAVSIGFFAGNNLQGTHSIAIGANAGFSTQGAYSVAIGVNAGTYDQSETAVAIGRSAGRYTQGARSVAIGSQAGFSTQGANSVAIGKYAGGDSQGARSVAIGKYAGGYTQGTYSVAIGDYAGSNTQGAYSVAVGPQAGSNTQGTYSVAIGQQAGSTTQGAESVAIGSYAGSDTQGGYSVAIGSNAGQYTQGNLSVAIGISAGGDSQGGYSVAIGLYAGSYSQGEYSVAIGRAGNSTQGGYAVAIGQYAGHVGQGNLAVAIGKFAGGGYQGVNSVAIGNHAGNSYQGVNSVAIGKYAGATLQGANSIAIGANAGYTSQGNNSIIINATGANLDQTTANTFTVAPVRNDVSNIAEVMFYNATSKEVTYGNTISIAGNISAGNVSATNGNFTTANVSGQLISTIATGTAPLVVTSTTLVANLNANTVNGATTASANTASTIALRDANGNVSANFFIGNGSQLTDIAVVSSSISNGTSNVNIAASGGNITAGVGGTANVLILTTTGANITGTANVSGLVTGANISTASGNGTVQANNHTATGAATGNLNVSTITGNLGFRSLASTYTDDSASASGTIALAAVHALAIPTIAASNATVTVTTGATLYVAGAPANSTNITTFTNPYALYVAAGNSFFGGNIIGNLANGNSSVKIPAANGNVNITAVGNTTLVITGTGANITGTLNVSGNANIGLGNVVWNGTNFRVNTSKIQLGANAGLTTQGANSVAIGQSAGYDAQGANAVATGVNAGYYHQGAYAVAIGSFAGYTDQQANTVAIGRYAGYDTQGVKSVAIGLYAGWTLQGANAIAIGASAGIVGQGANSIIINATGANLNQTVANTFTVAPIRNDTSNIANALYYNFSTKEITFAPPAGGSSTNVVAYPDSATITLNSANTDIGTQTNTQVAGTLTIAAPTGSPTDGQKIMIRLQATNTQTFSFNAVFNGSLDLSLPTVSSNGSKYDYLGFIYNSGATKWNFITRNFGFV